MGHTIKDTASKTTVVSLPVQRGGIFGPPPRLDRKEMLDDAKVSRADLAGTLRDIARVNRFLGGTRAVLSALKPLITTAAATKRTQVMPICILDIGTGSADIPRAIARAASRGKFPGTEHRAVMLRAIDRNPKVLALARRLTPRNDYPGIDIEEADALALPYPDGAFDIAFCAQTMHHFTPDECVRLLSEMDRVTTTGFVVSDLIRSRAAAFWIMLWTRLTFANRLTRHDAPVSVLRAYTVQEYAAMANAAGLPDISLHRVPPYRMVLVYQKRNRASDAVQ